LFVSRYARPMRKWFAAFAIGFGSVWFVTSAGWAGASVACATNAALVTDASGSIVTGTLEPGTYHLDVRQASGCFWATQGLNNLSTEVYYLPGVGASYGHRGNNYYLLSGGTHYYVPGTTATGLDYEGVSTLKNGSASYDVTVTRTVNHFSIVVSSGGQWQAYDASYESAGQSAGGFSSLEQSTSLYVVDGLTLVGGVLAVGVGLRLLTKYVRSIRSKVS